MLLLATGFAEQGMKVDLVLAKAEGPYLSQVPGSIRIIDLSASRVMSSLPGLVRYLKNEQPIGMLSALGHANIVALWAKRIANVRTKIIVTEHGLRPSTGRTAKERILAFMIRHFYRWASQVVAVSQGLADDLAQRFCLNRRDIHVIYNPVVTPDLRIRAKEAAEHPWLLPGEPPVIIGVGRLTRQKDFHTLIRAFARLRKRRRARLMILGEGEDRASLQDLIKELSIEADVSLPGFVSNPYSYMARSAVFVLSSAWEGFGNVIVEAMAVGTPVVSTDCRSGPREILQDGKYGQLVAVGDDTGMSSAIELALDSWSALDICSEVVNEYRLEVITSRYLQLFSADGDKGVPS